MNTREIAVNMERYILLPGGGEIKSTLTVFVDESDKCMVPEIVITRFPGWIWTN